MHNQGTALRGNAVRGEKFLRGGGGGRVSSRGQEKVPPHEKRAGEAGTKNYWRVGRVARGVSRGQC